MKIADLIDRLSKIEGPNTELDKRIAVKFGRMNEHGVTICAGYLGVGSFTSSIDAAVRLCDEVLRVHRLDLCIDPSGIGAEITWWPRGLSNGGVITSKSVTTWPSGAILMALFKAIQAKEGEGA